MSRRSSRRCPATSAGSPRPARSTTFRAAAGSSTARRSRSRAAPVTASRTASSPPARSPTKLPWLDLPTPRVMDSTGALELEDVPAALAGRRRRLHRPGNGLRLRRPGQQGHGRRADRRPACPASTAIWCCRCTSALRDCSTKSISTRRWRSSRRRQGDQGRAWRAPTSKRRSRSSTACWCRSAAGPTARDLGLDKAGVAVDEQGLRQGRRAAADDGRADFRHRRRGRRADAGPQGDLRRQDRGRGHRGRAGGVRRAGRSRPSSSPIRKSPGAA